MAVTDWGWETLGAECLFFWSEMKGWVIFFRCYLLSYLTFSLSVCISLQGTGILINRKLLTLKCSFSLILSSDSSVMRGVMFSFWQFATPPKYISCHTERALKIITLHCLRYEVIIQRKMLLPVKCYLCRSSFIHV